MQPFLDENAFAVEALGRLKHHDLLLLHKYKIGALTLVVAKPQPDCELRFGLDFFDVPET